jgi:hypothetical protein
LILIYNINFQGAFKGLSMFGEAMVSSVTGCKPSPVKRDCVTLDNGNRPGIVTVVDIQNIHNDHVSPYFPAIVVI